MHMDVFVLSNEVGIAGDNLGQTVKAMHMNFVQQAYEDLNDLYVKRGKRFSSSHWHWGFYSRIINVIDWLHNPKLPGAFIQTCCTQCLHLHALRHLVNPSWVFVTGPTYLNPA